ncbi:DUF1501 domain-containing protein [uncultured Algimonas sp.]|uniref:DUF1501 domain-containing protein n=1 Tax=uncultured Algimonas sp. TaxID=1547920 RepID=UPI002609D84B|nr:DUF1501 domain-containing protein [uncultured Algimonas sp.]
MTYYNRRLFLQASAAGFLGATGALAGLGRRQAFAATTGGYKAMVGLFLKGGADMFDAVLPTDKPSHDALTGLRPGIVNGHGDGSRSREALLPLSPSGPARFSGRTFGLTPELAPLKSMFDAGEAALVGAVGPLLAPTSRTGMERGTDALPQRLFSHNDQQSTWMAMGIEGVSRGWGGAFMDEMIRHGGVGNPDFSLITAGSGDIFLAAERALQFKAPSDPSGLGIDLSAKPYLTSGAHGRVAREKMDAFLADAVQGSDNLFARDVIAGQSRGIRNMRDYREAFGSSGGVATQFPDTRIGRQLKAVANAINLRGTIGNSRQLFYADTGGFDTHNNQAASMAGLLGDVAQALAAFRDALVAMGVWNDVTVFTMSDFGRTLTDNGDGTDHGWGSHQFVLGGAVQGGRFYGDLPELDPDSERFTKSRARLIPSVSVDQYAATLGGWFGLDSSEIARVLPNLTRFDTPDLGFMSGASA